MEMEPGLNFGTALTYTSSKQTPNLMLQAESYFFTKVTNERWPYHLTRGNQFTYFISFLNF